MTTTSEPEPLHSLPDLPVDCLRKVFSLCDYKSKLALSQVSKELNALTATDPEASFLSGAHLHVLVSLLDPASQSPISNASTLEYGYVSLSIHPSMPSKTDILLRSFLDNPRVKAASTITFLYSHHMPDITPEGGPDSGEVVYVPCSALLDQCLGALSRQQYKGGLSVELQEARTAMDIEDFIQVLRANPISADPYKLKLDLTKLSTSDDLTSISEITRGFDQVPDIELLSVPLLGVPLGPLLSGLAKPIGRIRVGNYSTMLYMNRYNIEHPGCDFRILSGLHVSGVEYFLPFPGLPQDLAAVQSLAGTLEYLSLQNLSPEGYEALRPVLPNLTSLAELELFINDLEDSKYGRLDVPPSLKKVYVVFRAIDPRETFELDIFPEGSSLQEIMMTVESNRYTVSAFRSLKSLVLGPSLASVPTLAEFTLHCAGAAVTLPLDLSTLEDIFEFKLCGAASSNLADVTLPPDWISTGIQFAPPPPEEDPYSIRGFHGYSRRVVMALE